MSENVKLTREQIVLLSFVGVIGNIVYSHTWIDNNTDRAAWVAALLGILLVIPFAVWIFYLGKFSPQSTVFEILEAGLGKIPSSAISIIYILINIAVAVAQINMFTAMINVFFLEYTPPWIIMLLLTMICAMFVNGGIKPFARLVEIATIIGIFNYTATFAHAFQYFNIEYVIPIFDTSWTGFFKGTIFIVGAASECLLMLMVLVCFVPDPAKHYMWVVKGIVLSALVFSSAILVIMAMLSPELAKRIAFGAVNAARLIKIGDFVQGLEVFIFGTYQIIAVGKITMCMYCAWSSAKNIFNNKKPLLQLLVTALMIFVPSVWLGSYNKAYFLAVALGGYIILPFSVFILLLASISVYIKNKKAESV